MITTFSGKVDGVIVSTGGTVKPIKVNGDYHVSFEYFDQAMVFNSSDGLYRLKYSLWLDRNDIDISKIQEIARENYFVIFDEYGPNEVPARSAPLQFNINQVQGQSIVKATMNLECFDTEREIKRLWRINGERFKSV